MKIHPILIRAVLSILILGASLSPGNGQTLDPLERVEGHSLLLREGAPPLPGYFPIGFVGREYQHEVELGANLTEDINNSSLFLNGGSFVVPEAMPYGNRSFSMAWASNSLQGSFQTAGEKGNLPFQTRYGPIPAAPDIPGAPAEAKKRYRPVLFDPGFQKYLIDFVRAHVEARNPETSLGKRVQFWGLDNEWEGTPDYSDPARKQFAQWLQAAYGDIAGLNEAWQVHYATFDEAAQGPLPGFSGYKESPGAFLDFWTFESDFFTTFLAKLGQTMYTADPVHRGVIHKATQQTIEMPEANRRRIFDQAEFADQMRPYSGGYLGNDVYGAGDRQAYEVNYLYNAIRPDDRKPGYGVLLTEANNHGGPGHQFASTFWRLLPNGLKGADLFTFGYLGAVKDWSQFGFIEPATGAPREKLCYAARAIQMIHRTEAFWTRGIPAEGVPRVAILMPRRDVLLSQPNPPHDMWGYPSDHRWKILRWLCEQGYWVDVIPYQKLNPTYLKSYQGLFLIGAEHLTADECRKVADYAKGGGVIVADARAGYFDEHHRVRNQLDGLLGIHITGYDEKAVVKIDAGEERLQATGAVTVAPGAASARSMAFFNEVGGGRVLYFPFVLGSLENKTPAKKLDAQIPDGPTADSEEYLAYSGEFAMGQWLGKALRAAGIVPGTAQIAPSAAVLGKLRIEQPMVDADGNCAIVVANRAQNRSPDGTPAQEILPPQVIEVTLPPGKWSQAQGLWASAENSDLVPLPVHPTAEGKVRLDLPEIRTAGVCYLFRSHPPLIGLSAAAAEAAGSPGIFAVKPGQPLRVKARLFNTTGATLADGALRLRALDGWQVTPASLPARDIPAGEGREFEFTVTPPAAVGVLQPDWFYPLVAVWNDGKKDASLFSMSVRAELDASQTPMLLSDNIEFPDTYPYLLHTGATYRYLAPEEAQVADPAKKDAPRNTALLSGFSSPGRTNDPGRSELHFAKYQAKAVDIVFDLQSVRRVMRVSMVRGPSPFMPSRVKVLTSENGQDYATQCDLPVTVGNLPKLDLPPFNAAGRYVRLQIEWPQVGGTLGQVEIWGQ